MNWKAAAFLLSLLVAVLAAGFWETRSVRSSTRSDEGRDDRARRVARDLFNTGVEIAAGQVKTEKGVPGWSVPLHADFFPSVYIEAKYPVAVSWVPEDYADLMDERMFQRMAINYCLTEHVLKNYIPCELDSSTQAYELVIRDERTPAPGAPPNQVHLYFRFFSNQPHHGDSPK